MPPGVGNVLQDLLAQGTVAERSQASLQGVENLLLTQVGELFTEALEVAEGVFVDEANQAEQFEERVLERGGGEEQFGHSGQRPLEHVGDDVARLVHVAQPVRFVDDDEIPVNPGDVGSLRPGELVGAKDDAAVRLERPELPLPDCVVVGLGFEDTARKKELLLQFLIPLLPKVRWRDDENAPLPLRPFLGENEPSLNGLSKSDFIRKERAL